MERWYQKISKKLKKIEQYNDRILKNPGHVKLKFSDRLLAMKHSFSAECFKIFNLNKENIDDYINNMASWEQSYIDGDYKIVLDNKMIFTEMFGKYVNVPKIFYYIQNRSIRETKGKKVDIDEFIEELKNKKVIIKPIDGIAGEDVHLFENCKGKLLWDYCEISKRKLIENIENSENCMVTEYIKQHEYASKIWNKSANTIRIVTCKDPETGKFVIPCAVHRFGNKYSGCVDNFCQGGYSTEIDLETGKLGYSKTKDDITPIEVHPDSKAQIRNVTIPNWDKIKKEILDVAKKFYYIPLIAWDIVITENGYTVLEVNNSSGLRIFQIFYSLKDTALWKLYKHCGIIK